MAAEAAQHIKGFGAVERRLSVLQSRDRRSSLLQTQAKLLDRIAKGETQKFKDDAGNLHPLQFLRIEGKPGAELPSFLPSSQNQMEPPRMSTHKKTQKTDQWKAFHGNDDEKSNNVIKRHKAVVSNRYKRMPYVIPPFAVHHNYSLDSLRLGTDQTVYASWTVGASDSDWHRRGRWCGRWRTGLAPLTLVANLANNLLIVAVVLLLALLALSAGSVRSALNW